MDALSRSLVLSAIFIRYLRSSPFDTVECRHHHNGVVRSLGSDTHNRKGEKPPHLLDGFALSSHNLEFALGCLGSYLLRHHRPRHPKFYLIAGFVWFATAAVFDASLFKYFGNTHRILSYGFPAFLIVVGSVTQELEGRLTVPRLLTYLGDASYSIYLIHYPLLSLTAKLVLKFHIVSLLGPFTSVILMIVLVTAAGCCCYSFIEKPMLETLRKKFLPQPLRNPA